MCADHGRHLAQPISVGRIDLECVDGVWFWDWVVWGWMDVFVDVGILVKMVLLTSRFCWFVKYCPSVVLFTSVGSVGNVGEGRFSQ